jgi:hypothetical protein
MKRIIQKIIATLAALFLIIVVISFANSLVGNPITKSFARKDISKYLTDTYPDTDYTIQNVTFNFKFHEYNGNIISPSSKDSFFCISWRDGKIINDSFKFDVTERQNTVCRYEREAREQINELLSTIPNTNINHVHVTFNKDFFDSDITRSLVLDSPYDKSLELPMELTISCSASAPSLENYASLLEQVHAVLRINGYKMSYYSIENYDDNDATVTLCAFDISPEDIESGNLLVRLKEALDHPNEDNYDKKEDRSIPEKRLHVDFFERK